MNADQLAQYFDHTQLRAYATDADFETLCAESRKYHFRMVAINPAPVRLCKRLLAGTDIHVGSAIGFPLGQSTREIKKLETENALENGADEIDYVVNLTRLKEKDYTFIEKEMEGIVETCRARSHFQGNLRKLLPDAERKNRAVRYRPQHPPRLCQDLDGLRHRRRHRGGRSADGGAHPRRGEGQGGRRYPHAGRRSSDARPRGIPNRFYGQRQNHGGISGALTPKS